MPHHALQYISVLRQHVQSGRTEAAAATADRDRLQALLANPTRQKWEVSQLFRRTANAHTSCYWTRQQRRFAEL